MTAPALVALAHGSRDARSAATVRRLTDLVRAGRASLEVRAAFLDLSEPRLGDVLAELRGAGHRRIIVVPLLLGSAFHARVDVPAVVGQVCAGLPDLSVTVSEVLGPDPRLESLALRRLLAAGARAEDERLGVVVAGAGSSHPPANRAVSAVAHRWAASRPWAATTVAFAGAAPDPVTAVIGLRERGATRIAVASWFLAPGLLPDRIASQIRAIEPNAVIAPPMGAAPELAEVVLVRYDQAATRLLSIPYRGTVFPWTDAGGPHATRPCTA